MQGEFNREHVAQAETTQLAHAWEDRLRSALDDFLTQESRTKEAFIALLWENAILERVIPTDVREQQARYDLKKAVWEGNRNDVELYVRILYSAAAALHALNRNHTVAASGESLINPIFTSSYRVIFDPECKKQLFPDIDNPMPTIVSAIMQRAKTEIQTLDPSQPTDIIPIGAHGSWNGIPFVVDSYTDAGLIWPKVETYEDRNKLFALHGDTGIPPEELHPKDFTIT